MNLVCLFARFLLLSLLGCFAVPATHFLDSLGLGLIGSHSTPTLQAYGQADGEGAVLDGRPTEHGGQAANDAETEENSVSFESKQYPFVGLGHNGGLL